MLLGQIFPNPLLKTTHGNFKLHDWIGDKWAIFMSHPADFTPVCTTELACCLNLHSEFVKRNTKVIGLSCESISSHTSWFKDIQSYAGSNCDAEFSFPVIEDTTREIAKLLGMLDPEERDKAGVPLTARALFIISPDKRLKLSILYPATTGRSFKEVLRVLDSLQLTSHKKVATPENWSPGEEVVVHPSVTDEEAPSLFPNGLRSIKVPSGKSYLRMAKL